MEGCRDPLREKRKQFLGVLSLAAALNWLRRYQAPANGWLRAVCGHWLDLVLCAPRPNFTAGLGRVQKNGNGPQNSPMGTRCVTRPTPSIHW